MKNLNKIRILVFVIIILAFIAFNKEIMPARREITELELVKVIGMDIINEGKYKVEETVVRIPIEESASKSGKVSGGSTTSGDDSMKPKIFSTKGVSFSDVVRSFQTYTNRTMAGSHIKVIILGNNFADKDMIPYLDFNYRDYELRLNSSVYVAKDVSAKEFISEASNNEYGIDAKIESMEKNTDAKGISDKYTITDLMAFLANKKSCGLIPSLEITSKKGEESTTEDKNGSNNIQDFQTAALTTSKNVETFFDYGGYGIIKDRKIIGYLSRENSITCNLLKNKLKGSNINIDLGNDDLVSFGVFSSSSSYKFKFDGDKLTDVIIDNNMKLNVEEVRTDQNISTYSNIEDFESKISDQIEREIYKIIDEMKKYNCDFIGISDFFKKSHPYKFEKMEKDDTWTDQLLNAKFTVDSHIKILRTYDILQVK